MLDKVIENQKIIKEACEKLGRQIKVMEVCGTHTVAIFRHGIRAILPQSFKMLTGPGCPVCVTDQGYIDTVLQLAENKDVLIATYGDMIRVPGKGGALETKTTNKNVRIVLSAQGALELAKENPQKQVVFIAVGFETTTPATAVVVKEAAEQNIRNFTIFSNHKLVVPAMRALLAGKNDKIDAFLCPGHVSAITGYGIFEQIVAGFNRPCVVAGFEPMQILEGLTIIAQQLAEGKPELKSVYKAVVTQQGNAIAQNLVKEYFQPADGYWRGLGSIPQSTLRLKDKYSKFDTMARFGIKQIPAEESNGCRCGEVLCGLIDPPVCQFFGKQCSPQRPIGPCMVSNEGACSAWYKYGDDRGGN
ncbi:MAG: hydrogenase formation protein HypD [Phycisphaerae bacterium]|nr:hydrogenase formation protein HypD [Phycisphaerae bacterium]